MKDMTLDQLVARLEAIRVDPKLDTEGEHIAADRALIDYIGDRKVEKAYDAIEKWYA